MPFKTETLPAEVTHQLGFKHGRGLHQYAYYNKPVGKEAVLELSVMHMHKKLNIELIPQTLTPGVTTDPFSHS